MKVNNIYNEDCLETMSKMNDNSIDYVLTSPPYNVGKNGLNGEGKKYNIHKDNLSNEEYFDLTQNYMKFVFHKQKELNFIEFGLLISNMLIEFLYQA